jgi:AraC family transcriptional regulator, transcriptional activator of pobA
LVRMMTVDAGRLCAGAQPPAADELVQRALDLVDEQYQRPLSLSDVARQLAVTPGHLTEIVRRRSGRPLGQWILQRRLAQARLLLAQTTRPVRQVAVECGFSDVGHFSRQFRRHHGFSPAAWRTALSRSQDSPPGRPEDRQA